MRQPRSLVIRLLLTAVVVLSLTPAGLPLAGSAGITFARCIKACASARQACDRQCLADCQSIAPANPARRKACQSQCRHSCVETESDCRLDCKAIKNGNSPSDP